ncbi:MAG: hypothetical protein ABFS17_06185 [Chloroflexota bacterium]
MSKIDDILQEIKSQLGAEFISTDIVGMDGLSIAGGSADPDFESSEASARFAMVMKLASKVGTKIKMGEVEDALTTTDQLFILTRFLGDGSHYWGLAVTQGATLGVVRMLMNEYADQLWDAIPR